MEVLSWNFERRKRYLETFNQGKTKMFRARGMLVGCTGAGKTTLLERLKGKSAMQQPLATTLGLEIHKNVFEIVSGKMEGVLFSLEYALFNPTKGCLLLPVRNIILYGRELPPQFYPFIFYS
jgi:GTPase SAR1 family protein